VPNFCRHGRIVQNCRICSKPDAPAARARTTPVRRAARSGPPARATGRGSTAMRVRRVERAADDGYVNELVPGLRATVDAERLADELTFATARLDELAADPPGLYDEVGAAADEREAAWLVFLIAYLAPTEDSDDPFAGIRAARAGELDDLPLGPRTSHDPAHGSRTLDAFRAWHARTDLRGEAGWSPQRRFARAYERLALPGLSRGARYDFLVTLGRLGVHELEPGGLLVGGATEPVTVAAKRVFGIGDAINIERRASELAAETGVPMAALDLGLFNWSAPAEGRATYGSRVGERPRDERVSRALGV
jgi:hypothetical protein